MRFEELPPHIQELVGDRTEGEVVFRPPPGDEREFEFVRLKQVEFNGLLSACSMLEP
jgi:hypothetical protein